jgi:hypothetical protein
MNLSEETGSEDRLNCRRIAAERVFKELSEEERQRILDKIEENYKEAMKTHEEVIAARADGEPDENTDVERLVMFQMRLLHDTELRS